MSISSSPPCLLTIRINSLQEVCISVYPWGIGLYFSSELRRTNTSIPWAPVKPLTHEHRFAASSERQKKRDSESQKCFKNSKQCRDALLTILFSVGRRLRVSCIPAALDSSGDFVAVPTLDAESLREKPPRREL